MLISNSYLANVTFPHFCVDCAKSFPRCRNTHLKLIYLSKYLSVWCTFLLSDDHKTKYRSRFIPKDDMRVSASTTVRRTSDIVRRKKSTQKSHWLTGWNCFLLFKKNFFKHGRVGYSFFQTFCSLIQWCTGSYETVFRISTTSANHFLKVFILACKSFLLKFHLRN